MRVDDTQETFSEHIATHVTQVMNELQEKGFAHPMISVDSGNLADSIVYDAAVCFTLPSMLAQYDDDPLHEFLVEEQTANLSAWQTLLELLPQAKTVDDTEAPELLRALQNDLGKRLPQQADHWRNCLLKILTHRWLNILRQKPTTTLPLCAAPIDNLMLIWHSNGHLPATWQADAVAWAGLRNPSQWQAWAIEQHQRLPMTTTKHGQLLLSIADLSADAWARLWLSGDRWTQIALLCDWQLRPERASWFEAQASLELPSQLIGLYLTQHPNPDQALRRITPLIAKHRPSLPTALAISNCLIERQQFQAAADLLPELPQWHQHHDSVVSLHCEIIHAQQGPAPAAEHAQTMTNTGLRRIWQDRGLLAKKPLLDVLEAWQGDSLPPHVSLAASSLQHAARSEGNTVAAWLAMAERHAPHWQQGTDSGTWQQLVDAAHGLQQH